MTGACPFCNREGVEMVGSGEVQFCRSCAELIDVPAALKHLPEKPEETNARLGKFEIIREVGRGVTGAVYEARDPTLDRRVALKVLEEIRLGADPMRRFLREGRLLAKIRHPNVVEIHELGREEGKAFIAMEYVDGVPFPGTQDRNEALSRLMVVAKALDHVHRQGIIHRDLKPSNILVEKSGRPVLMDFGIARSEDGGATAATATGSVLGTPGYMAPEQIAGDVREIDARTDVYALGVLLFEILTGQLPYEASSVKDYAERVKSGRVPGPRSIRKDVPQALDRLCRKAMAFRREERPSGAEPFAAALASARSAAPSLLGRRPLAVLAAAGALVLVGASVAWWARGAREAREDLPPPSPAGRWIEEAANRNARALGGGLSFDAAMAEVGGCESLYRRALEADPRSTAALVGLGRLYAELGRATEAHREFSRVLALDPGNLEVLRAKGNLLVTAQLELLLDRKQFPKVSNALADQLAEQQGRFMDDLLRQLPPAGASAALARVYRSVARSDFEEAKRLLPKVPSGEEPLRLGLAIQALIEHSRPSGPLSGRGDEEGSADRGEAQVWVSIVRHLERRGGKARPAGAPQSQRTRIHGAILRLEAHYWEVRNDRSRAAECLAHATVAAPDYLQVRLLHARLLKEMGQKEQSARETEAADHAATAMGLGAVALQEIRSVP